MQPFSTDINFDRRFSQGCQGFRTAAGGFTLTETLEGTLVDLFKTISLSANTVARRVEDIGSNLMCQLKSKSKEFEYFSIALDESTDINDTSQLLIFIRYA